MSTLSKITGYTAKTAKNDKPRRRSSSVSAVSRVKESRRFPAIPIEQERDLSTLVCVEVTTKLIRRPEVDTKFFFELLTSANKDLTLSDCTIALSAAILYQIGSKDNADEMLAKSQTVTRNFEKMNLRDPDVRKMFVTMMFCIAPQFAKMIEGALRVSIERGARVTNTVLDDTRVANAISSVLTSGDIGPTEAQLIADLGNANDRRAIIASKYSEVSPSDSASAIGLYSKVKSAAETPIYESDIMEHIRRKSEGKEPDFSEVFKSAKPPITVKQRPKGQGLGYNPEWNKSKDVVSAMDRLFISGLKPEHNPVNKAGAYAKLSIPRASITNPLKYLDSESISLDAVREPTEVSSSYTIKPGIVRPSPTELFEIENQPVPPGPAPRSESFKQERPPLRHYISLDEL